jgi:hypothetical protein
MLGVTRIPAKYRIALLRFKDAFCESQNYSSFAALACALIATQGGWTVTDLTDVISRPDEKSRRAYDGFFTDATWNASDLSQLLIEYICARLRVDRTDDVCLHIDDTFDRKFGDATDGVANFRNPVNGRIEDGNVLVTSCIQTHGLYFPYRVVTYIGEEEAPELGERFRTKLEIALEDIIEPLQLPAEAAVMVVADSAYYSKDVVTRVLKQGYDIVCRLKSDKHIRPSERFGTCRVRDYADELSFEEVTVCVRDTVKTYRVAEALVTLPDSGIPIRLIVSEIEGNRRYYMSTDLDRTAVEILEFAEDRWNIETFHQQADAKLGLKQYQLESKEGIERFLQLVCVVWALVVLEEVGDDESLWEEGARLGDRLGQAEVAFEVESLLEFCEIASSLPSRERRRAAREFISRFGGSSLAVVLITVPELLRTDNIRFVLKKKYTSWLSVPLSRRQSA